MFSLRDTELFTLLPGSPVPKLREELEKVVNTQIPRFFLNNVFILKKLFLDLRFQCFFNLE